jgi:hypothetical protein
MVISGKVVVSRALDSIREKPHHGAALGPVTWMDVCRHDVSPLMPRHVFGAAALTAP